MRHIILCGGSGTRLWPLSRELMPKQFLKLFEQNRSLFQLTLLRNLPLVQEQLIIANQDHYFLALDELEELGLQPPPFILEPFGRNTAPAIAFGAMASHPEDLLLVTPADHLIEGDEGYRKALQRAIELAREGALVTFGIPPKTPHTGYGYIEAHGEDVIRFHEKPPLSQAKEYLKRGNFFWNSGIFLFQAKTLLQELAHHQPELYGAIEKAYMMAKGKGEQGDPLRIPPEGMEAIESISIDYALLEKSGRVKMVQAPFQWSDVGSFEALSEAIPGDPALELKAKNNFVLSKRTVGLIGVEDLIVVDTADALLILKRGFGELVKELIKEIPDPQLLRLHRKVHRPWGSYEVLVTEQGYKIKRIVVKPGKRLSLQKHFHRNEHWIVLSGTALVQVGDREYLLRPNESTYIEAGELHRLTNPGKLPLILLEAQVGEYVGEDDIVRIEDDFKRE
ncbi:MAG: mannose-1-phosphate guanylyltransferase/mannose-6-phosphate isomerase [Nitratiruptor sp.]|nr:mannose-1-phosphate guanylyltransferase/mannose-6-phosphate isomerase [Nitratiruptor sp.]NPA83861.1 mannose-1-phosphate guanylyltransferase/mannose-6-phosphate isomerase [Campylobacterota bacterium]